MKNLTQGNIYKTFFFFGAPLVLSGLLAQAYGIIDTSVAGKLIGEQALAATGVTSPLTTFLSSVFWGFGAGFSVYLARLFGEGKYKKIRSSVALSFIIQLIAAAAIVAACLIFHKRIFTLLNVDAAVEKEAFEYYAVYVTGLIFIVFNNTFLFILNAFGISLFQLYMSALSTVLNIGGNVLLVKCGLGVKGLAIASVFAAVMVDICYLIKLRACYKEMGADKEKIALKGINFKDSFAYSLPNTAQQMVMYLSSLLLSPMVNAMGKSASAAYAVALTLFNLVQAVYCNSSKALSNYAAQCVGQKKYDKIRKGMPAGLLQGFAFTLPFIAVCALFPNAVCSLFFKADASEETRRYAVEFSRIYVPFTAFCVINNLFHALFRGVKASACLFTSTLAGAAIRVVASALLIGKYGMTGFYAGWAVSWLGEALYAFALFLTDVWNPVKKKKSAPENPAAAK